MPSAATTTRKVYFFRVSEKDKFVDRLESVVEHIGNLKFDAQGRYMPVAGEDTVLALFVSQHKYPIKVQFARIRRDNLPLIEKRGEISGLDIDEDAGIMDWGHIMMFPDGIVAAEFNQDAPRIRRLGQYLMFKSSGLMQECPKFLPLFQRNVIKELEKFDYASILEIEGKTIDADLIGDGNESIGDAFKACRKAGQVNRVSLVLKNQSYKKNDLLSIAKSLFSNPKSRESLNKLKLYGKSNGARKPLDMLEEYLISTEKFVKKDSRHRSIDSDHAFDIIEQSYNEKRGTFENAAVANDFDQ